MNRKSVAALVTLVSIITPVASLFAADATQATSQPFSDTIEFTNKDRIHGNLAGIAAGPYGVRWENEAFEKSVAFAMAKVAKIQLGKRQPPAASAHKAIVRLTNNDMLRCSIVSFGSSNLVVETAFAGRLSIPRKMIRSIHPNQASGATVYEGPTDLASWTIGQGGATQKSWTFKDETLVCTGNRFPIGRFIDNMPDAVDIQFDVSWGSGYPQFSFMFLVDNLQYPDNGGYALQTGSSSVYLNRYTKNHGSRSTGDSASIERFGNGKATKASYRILVSRETKTIVLIVDGDVVKQWNETAGISGTGKGISFYPQNNGTFKISNISVSSWDGKIPQPNGAAGVQKEDMIKLSNNDKVSGTVKTIAADQLKFEAAYAAMDIPLARVVEIQLATENAEKASQNKDDVRATFINGGTITIQLGRQEQGKLEGKSDNFGTVSMPLAAFRALEFNIYDKPDGEARTAGPNGEEPVEEIVE